MEIKRVEENEKKEYPKKEEMGEKKIKKTIPTKWKVAGVTVALVSVIGIGIGIKVFDREPPESPPYEIPDQNGYTSYTYFNSMFEQFEGETVSGKYVKLLISNINQNNLKAEENDARLITIYADKTIIENAADNEESLMTYDDIIQYKTNLIHNSEKYNVSFKKDKDGFINCCIIEEAKK